MSLTYPIAENGTQALTAPKGFARTKSAAKREVDAPVAFETEWLRPNPKQAEDWQADIRNAASHGAAQIYESDKGDAIIAINYWKIIVEEAPVVPRPMAGEGKVRREDHADDLYFRRGRTKPGKRKPVDPNQMDLFGGSPSDDG